MIITHYQYSAESMLDQKQFEEGALYFIQDTQNIYLDPVGGSERIKIANDLNILENETDRTNLLAPIPDKIYFVCETSKFYIYHNNIWYDGGINKEYVDNAVSDLDSSMKTYVNQQIAAIDTGATNEYVDNSVNTAKNTLTSYINNKIAAIDTGASEEYVDNAVTNLNNSMKTYINQQIANIDTGASEQYVDNAIQEATENMVVDVPTLQEHLAGEKMILSSLQYGTTLPSTGVEGQVFFLIVT